MSARQVIAIVWEFASESSPGKVYQTIQYTDGSTSCDCPGWRFKRKVAAGGARTCKHVRFVDMGTADAHATGRKDYERVQGQPERQQPKFKIGDTVTFTNDQGCVYPGKTITAIQSTPKGTRYFYTPTDTPWFPVREDQLSQPQPELPRRATQTRRVFEFD